MAHKKAGGSKAGQGGNVAGKRLGIKITGGQKILAGQIILRQRGRTITKGDNVIMGKDYTIHAGIPGTVEFSYKNKRKKKVSVRPLQS